MISGNIYKKKNNHPISLQIINNYIIYCVGFIIAKTALCLLLPPKYLSSYHYHEFREHIYIAFYKDNLFYC